MTPPLMQEMNVVELLLNNPLWIALFVLLVSVIFTGIIILKQSLHEWRAERKLKKRVQEVRADFERKFDHLKKESPNDKDAYFSLQADEYAAEKNMEEWRNCLYSDRLLRKAPEYDVEVPALSDKEMWQYTDDGDEFYLSLRGRDLMRDRINQAKDRDSADWARRSRIYVPILSLLVALASVLTSILLAWALKK